VSDSVRRTTWVVIAAYDEATVIGEVVSALVGEQWNVVVVDDGSIDGTAAAAREAGATVLRHVVNLGQGAALQTGVDFALSRGAERIVTFDADGQHSVEDLPAIVAGLDRADVVFGSRRLGQSAGAGLARRILLSVATVVSNRMSGLSLTDAHCGLRAFRASAAPMLRLTQNRMAHASEFSSLAAKSGLTIAEAPAHVRYTAYSKKKGQSGLQAIRILFDYLFRT
jgi:glycosyltransferase involved in cell wall biosynthesis